MTNRGNYNLAYALSKLLVRPKVFVSYHHKNDQEYYNYFSELFSNDYEILYDASVDRKIDSDDTEYQIRRIREKYITGTSLTIVLCGAETWKRKFVDWEICATLNKKHALLGINLPTNPINQYGKYIVPGRLYENIESGFAGVIQWTTDPKELYHAIIMAREKANRTSLIRNSALTMRRNKS